MRHETHKDYKDFEDKLICCWFHVSTYRSYKKGNLSSGINNIFATVDSKDARRRFLSDASSITLTLLKTLQEKNTGTNQLIHTL